MLFSNDAVADYINRSFEPVWESVRPVPVVRIDFGNNNVITRTLNGNIATYVCAADGQVLDLLPGIYEPAQYKQSLEQLRLLATYLDQANKDERLSRLREYHTRRAEALEQKKEPLAFEEGGGATKRVIEKPTIKLVAGERPRPVPASTKGATGGPDLTKLVEDSRINETVRRTRVHRMLEDATPVWPDEIKKWLYKEVLHADLDDPYLGLGPTLLGSYPFAVEDRMNSSQ